MSQRWSAHELIDLVLDPGSYESWDEPIDISGHSAGYQDELRAAAERAGTDESVITGRGLVRGRPVAFVVNEFSFLGGSIGIGLGGADRCLRTTGHRRGSAAARHPCLGRYPDAGGHSARSSRWSRSPAP